MAALVLFLAVPVLFCVIAIILAIYHRGSRHQQNVLAYQQRQLRQLQQQRLPVFMQPADPAATVARLNQLMLLQQQARQPVQPTQQQAATPPALVANLPRFAYGVMHATTSSSSKLDGSTGMDGRDSNAQDPQDVCCICFGEFQPKDECTMLPCCHHYHSDCITTWLARSKHCPLCNSDVVAAASYMPGGLVASEPVYLSAPPEAALYDEPVEWSVQEEQQQQQHYQQQGQQEAQQHAPYQQQQQPHLYYQQQQPQQQQLGDGTDTAGSSSTLRPAVVARCPTCGSGDMDSHAAHGPGVAAASQAAPSHVTVAVQS